MRVSRFARTVLGRFGASGLRIAVSKPPCDVPLEALEPVEILVEYLVDYLVVDLSVAVCEDVSEADRLLGPLPRVLRDDAQLPQRLNLVFRRPTGREPVRRRSRFLR